MSNNIYNQFTEELKNLERKDQLRQLNNTETIDGKYVIFNNKKLLNLSSNDYLGIATNKPLYHEFISLFTKQNNILNLSSSSSRLLTGNYAEYINLENQISKSYKQESSLIFNSGYHANTGIIPTISGKDDLIISDKLNHASIIDGIKLSNSTYYRYKHLDYNQLEKILISNRHKYKKTVIISESVFSMDGDIASLSKLVELKEKYNALLYIDEAHAVGVFGKNGLGICEEQNLISKIDIIIGTFGKALASHGAYAVSNDIIRNILINKARTLIFSTALPPITIAWNLFIFKKLRTFDLERKRLFASSKSLRKILLKKNLNSSGNTQIIPIIIGNNSDTVKLSKKIMQAGILAFAVRPPTVPVNTSRIRISLTSNILKEDLNLLENIL